MRYSIKETEGLGTAQVLPSDDARKFCRVLQTGAVLRDGKGLVLVAMGVSGNGYKFLAQGRLNQNGFNGEIVFRDSKGNKPRTMGVLVPILNSEKLETEVEMAMSSFEEEYFRASEETRPKVVEQYAKSLRGMGSVMDRLTENSPVVILGAGEGLRGIEAFTEMVGVRRSELVNLIKAGNRLSSIFMCNGDKSITSADFIDF